MNGFEYTLKSFRLSGGRTIHFYSLRELEKSGLVDLKRLPFCIRVLLESLLRLQSHSAFREEHVRSFAQWNPAAGSAQEEYPFLPARVLLQDFTGVPCIVDLAALRSAVLRAGKNPSMIEPRIPVDLVIDHSVQVDEYARKDSFEFNMQKEFERNSERYSLLRWGQAAFRKLTIVPPGLGICHQVNLEYLAKVVVTGEDGAGRTLAYPDTLVGTDSHTTMINGLGVLGWGVGGIEAEAAMLGQPIPILTPVVTGIRLAGRLQAGVTATDIALTVTQKLREKGVVGQFVEFFGPGVDGLTLADRATVSNMAPEYGATTGFFAVDRETLRYMAETGRSSEHREIVETYCREQGLLRDATTPEPEYSRVLDLDLSSVEASVSGPKRPQDRLGLRDVKTRFSAALTAPVKDRGYGLTPEQTGKTISIDGMGKIHHGSVVLAAITSCTNTSNPHVLLTAGLLAKKAVEKGLQVPGFVKTSLAPGSRVVTGYLKKAGLLEYLEKLNFRVVAYGCTTCIGNSGPLDRKVEAAIKDGGLVAAAVLSGNRNFEGRVHSMVKANYLCSPPLVVAYALAGKMDIDFEAEPIAIGNDHKPVFLKDLWPTEKEIQDLIQVAADPELYRKLYSGIASSNPAWNNLTVREDAVFPWDPNSTYIREPPFFADPRKISSPLKDLVAARILALFGDFITTDHISPAGAIAARSPAAGYLQAHGVQPADFNSFGSRRGNHEVMIRGTFGNIRIRNKIVDKEGGWTIYMPSGEVMSIYDAAIKYQSQNIPLVVIAGKMYGAGSSRDWAAKGTRLLGVTAVIAESFERIHRSNLVEMGVLPLEFVNGQTAESLGLTGKEQITIKGIEEDLEPGKIIKVFVELPERTHSFQAKCRIDSAIELDYIRQGGILNYVLQDLMK